MNKKSEGISIGDLVNIFLPKIWIIVIVAMLFGFAMGAYSLFIKDKTYTSEVTFDIPIGYVNINISELEFSQKLVDKYHETIQLKPFVRSVYDKVLADERYQECEDVLTTSLISDSLTFRQRGDTTLFTIRVTTTDNKLSYIIAEQVKNALTESKDEDELYVVAHPEQPTSPNSKNTVRNTLLGVILGMVLSMAVIFVASILDITVRDRKKLEDSFDYPILGVIPRYEVELEEEGDKRK